MGWGTQHENEVRQAWSLAAYEEGEDEFVDVQKMIRNVDPEVRYEACVFIVEAGKPSDITPPAVESLLRDESEMVRSGACAAIAALKYQDSAEAVSKLLDDEFPEVQGAACETLASLGGASSTLVGRMASKLDEPRSRLAAAKALGTLASEAASHFEAVQALLVDEDDDVRYAAAQAVGRIGQSSSPRPSCKGLQMLLSHEDGRFRLTTCVALGVWGLDAISECETELATLLADDFEMPAHTPLTLGGARAIAPASRRKLRCAAALALGGLKDTVSNELVARVGQMLTFEDWEARAVGCEALAMMGEKASSQAGYLLDALADPVAEVRAKAVAALAATNGSANAQNLAIMLDDPIPNVRKSAVVALGTMGQAGEEHVEKVYEKLQDRNEEVVIVAAETLGKMTEKGPCYAGVVAQLLREEQAGPRLLVAAINALGCMCERGAAFAEDVAAQLTHFAAPVREAAARCLGRMGEDSLPFLEEIRALQQDANNSVCRAAVDAVSMIAGASDSFRLADGE